MNEKALKRLFFFCGIMIALWAGLPPERGWAADREFVFYTGAQSPIKEILEERLKEAFRRFGEDSRLIATGSAQRALLMANEYGDGDAMRVPQIKTIAPDLTTNLFQIPEPIIAISFYVYTKKEDLRINGWESLADYHNGLRNGTKILEKNIPGRTTILPDSVRLMKMLDQGRLDTVTEHDMIGDAVIRDLNLPGILKLRPALVELPGYCFINKKYKHLISKIAMALADMKTDGSFASIKEKVIQGSFHHAPQ
ncbi:MAG: transporter substrate-binding domain-containing protein [Desulfobacterales bacterium]|nr:transporter substrate-binding domain-containing protein [Desulfobacterales bacterium]